MQITDLLKRESVELDGSAADKKDALEKLVALMVKQGNIADAEEYKKKVFAREEEGSTGVGEGVAIPHAKTAAVTRPGLAFMRCRDGVEFDSLDGQPAKLFFLIAAPDTRDNVHLDVLSRLSTLLMDPDFIDGLMAVDSVDGLYDLIAGAEKEKFPEEETEKETPAGGEEVKPQGYQVLAVTACPTGIAHTYMAAESLEQHAARRGISIKVETNGQSGVKNALTAEDIAGATGIIVAADKYVPMNRFKGKRVVIVKVADGINKADQLLDEALSGTAPVFEGEEGGTSAPEREAAEESQARKAYKHLMNGVSHMLPFVIGGGILIALAFLFDMGAAGTAKFGSSTPLAKFFKDVGGLAFSFMMPMLAGFIAASIADRPGLLVGFVAGAMAAGGGSGFFGALVGGFAAGYLILGVKKALGFLPDSLENLKPILLYPVLGLMIMGALMVLVINPVMGAVNQWVNGGLTSMSGGSKVLLGLVLGGMMSIDFGGPLNKAAYVFGTASLAGADGQAVSSPFMASVMIGGMVPPLAIAVACRMFPKKFTEQQRNSSLTNFVMGLSFITEGAIPFAAEDPSRVIPACCIGAAVAGALSMVFGCTIPAPHGGIFVFGVVHNWPMYLVSLAVGTGVGAVLLGVLKKNK
ncbi:MAG: fructose-specific PTS transporter subunit EIIC [Acidaminococcus sp.]|uniref:PTS fructose transporter subunit IIABC n=1 Tax=Acidaminococcus TaxID=904 RepID=UPI0026E102FE|nr:fructose-specific PTS transporter subunit EIIC [Acidaminococcus sp.]MDO5598438.1 fructose-specific PTS transporter subunit EIIC [Acidaminococcus sp.]